MKSILQRLKETPLLINGHKFYVGDKYTYGAGDTICQFVTIDKKIVILNLTTNKEVTYGYSPIWSDTLRPVK